MKKNIMPWVAVILWMALIFYLSHQAAESSNELSTGITEIIVNDIEKIIPNMDFDIRSFNYIVRKNAHFFAYLILGVIVMNALRRSGIHGTRSIGLALIICITYAILDEVHQLFVPGRSGQAIDVLIDSAGAAVGLGTYLLILKIIKVNNKGDICGNIF